MGCFALIKVHQDYDYVEGAECISSFSSEKDAQDFLSKLKAEQDLSWKNRHDYIREFVEQLKVPQMNYEEWKSFLEKLGIGRYIFPVDFKPELIRCLLTSNHKYPDPSYNPPVGLRGADNIFVVEIT
jgi:hypothetical protein